MNQDVDLARSLLKRLDEIVASANILLRKYLDEKATAEHVARETEEQCQLASERLFSWWQKYIAFLRKIGHNDEAEQISQLAHTPKATYGVPAIFARIQEDVLSCKTQLTVLIEELQETSLSSPTSDSQYVWPPSKPNEVMTGFWHDQNYQTISWIRPDGHKVSHISLGKRKKRASLRQQFIADLHHAWKEKRGLKSEELTEAIYGKNKIPRPSKVDWKGLFKKDKLYLRVWDDLVRMDGHTYKLNIKNS